MKTELPHWRRLPTLETIARHRQRLLTIGALLIGNAIGGYAYLDMKSNITNLQNRAASLEQGESFIIGQLDAGRTIDRELSLAVCENSKRTKFLPETTDCQVLVEALTAYRDTLAHSARETLDMELENRK